VAYLYNKYSFLIILLISHYPTHFCICIQTDFIYHHRKYKYIKILIYNYTVYQDNTLLKIHSQKVLEKQIRNPQRENLEQYSFMTPFAKGLHRWSSPMVFTDGLHRWPSPRVFASGIHKKKKMSKGSRKTNTKPSKREPRTLFLYDSLRQGSSPMAFAKGLHQGSSPMVFTKGLHQWSSPRVFAKGLHRWPSPRVFTKGLR
jgi:hypothetical protein